MAQRSGAGGAFRSLAHTDDSGFLRPSRRGQRLMSYDDHSEYDSDEASPHRQPGWGFGPPRHDMDKNSPEPERTPEPEHQFFIIREGTPAPREAYPRQSMIRRATANASPDPVACFMERTHSGRTILHETDDLNHRKPLLESADFCPEEDMGAAVEVKRHMTRPRANVRRHERILRALIHPKAHAHKDTDFPLDNAALESIFSAADDIFFQGRLSRRVHWEWSSGCADQPAGNRIIGTTALRRAASPRRGYETLIVLSSGVLKDTQYNRRLLISTFLHELIHSYLFICCGFKARHCGGHTDGFKEIAAMIDEWAGRGTLRLCDMEADLEHFRETPALVDDGYHHQHNNHAKYHHHGGVEFYDLNDTLWSTGPPVLFRGQGWGEEGAWSTGMPPISKAPSPAASATAVADHSRWEEYISPDAETPRTVDMRPHKTLHGPGAEYFPHQ